MVPVLLLTTLSFSLFQFNGVMLHRRAGFCLSLYRCAQPRRCENSHPSSRVLFSNDYLSFFS